MTKLLIMTAFTVIASAGVAVSASKVDCSSIPDGFGAKNWGQVQKNLKGAGYNNAAAVFKEEGTPVGEGTQEFLGAYCGIGSEAP